MEDAERENTRLRADVENGERMLFVFVELRVGNRRSRLHNIRQDWLKMNGLYFIIGF